jgi:hypothetical protein
MVIYAPQMNVSIVRAGRNLHMSRADIVIVELEERGIGQSSIRSLDNYC